MDVDTVLKAKTWAHLGVPKTKSELRKLQQRFHPDASDNANTHDAFTALMALWKGPEYSVRMASGYQLPGHQISWNVHDDFLDRVDVVISATSAFAKLEPKFSMFFPEYTKIGAKEVVATYGPDWWFLSDFGTFDSRTAVWIAKRLAAAITISTKQGWVHGDINPKTVVIKPTEHGLMLDGWWSAVRVGERLELRPEYAPPKYLGGAPADEGLLVAQAAHTLLKMMRSDDAFSVLLERYSLTPNNARAFLSDVDKVSTQLFGPRKWHPLAAPVTPMI